MAGIKVRESLEPMQNPPLVTCVTPTADRREFIPYCVAQFLKQDYPNLEWVVVDNGADSVIDLIPIEDPRVRYYRITEKETHGALMNDCFAWAQGEIVIVHDDDDWYSSDRVSRQVQPFLDRPSTMLTGTGRLYYWVWGTEEVYQYRNLTEHLWLGAFAVRKSVWEQHKFRDIPHSADFFFMHEIPLAQWYDLDSLTHWIATVHPGNTAATASGTTVTFDYPHANYASAADTGSATRSGDHSFNYTIIFNT